MFKNECKLGRIGKMILRKNNREGELRRIGRNERIEEK